MAISSKKALKNGKFIVFRAFEQRSNSVEELIDDDVKEEIENNFHCRFYFKFNCANDIKLIKNVLEQHGFKILRNQEPGHIKHWLLMWSTKLVKNSVYQKMLKHQKIN